MLDWGQLQRFVVTCNLQGVNAPSATVRGIELMRVAEEYRAAPSGPVLGLSSDELRERIHAVSVRDHFGFNVSVQGMAPGIEEVRQALMTEVREASIGELDRIVEQLQPEFKRHTDRLTLAVKKYGFTSITTSDEVILLADEKASAAWRASREAITALAPVATFRILMNKTYDLVPELRDASEIYDVRNGSRPVNQSINFGAADNWSATDAGCMLEGAPGGIDWMALAAGGLALNTPTQVRAKLEKRGFRKPDVPPFTGDDDEDDASKYTYPM